MEKKIDARFLNCFLFTNKKNNKSTLGISYILTDENAKLETDKTKGLQVYTCFSENVSAFDKISKSDSLEVCSIIFEEQPSPYNPLKTYMRLKSIKTKTSLIEL